MRPTTQVTGKENDMIKASIDGLELKISEREPLLAGTVGLNKISLSFSDEWSIFTKQIDFTNEHSGETRRISADVGVCTVPWELLRDEGDITCYVRGIGSDGSLVLRTNEANLGTVLEGEDGDAPDTGTPTPDVCDETAAKIGDLSKLETDEKTQLVGAINELKRAEGLGVFEVTLTSDDGVLTADKTFAQVKAAVEGGKPVLKVHSDGDVLWFFLLDKGAAEIDFFGVADDQILVYLTAKQDDTWETVFTARATAEMYLELSDKIGNLSTLTTTAKTNLVAAINELKSAAAAADVTEATVSGWGFTKNTGTYSKPASGIPKDDLAYPVRFALEQAAEAESHTRNQTRHITADERTAWNAKQDKLVAGSNISIAADGKTISVSGGITPLSGTTAEVTPMQVYQAVFNGTPVVVNYTDSTYGALDFTNFNIAEEFALVVSQTIVYYNGSYFLAELAGSATGGEWFFYLTTLAQADDIPQKTSQLTNDSGFLTKHQDISGKVDKVAGKGLSTNDYTNAAKAKVDAIPASPKYTDTVYDDTAVKSRLSAVEGMENVALTVASSRLANVSYTARYSSLLGMVFVRIYGTVNADMNTGYDYDIMNIGARLPNSHAALAVKSGKAAQAFAKSSGVISLRPLESGIKNYDVYIAPNRKKRTIDKTPPM